MSFYDWGNIPIQSTAVAQPVTNPSTATLCQELDSTQLGTANFATGQQRAVLVTWHIGASTNCVFQLEQANSTALSASTVTIFVMTPSNQTGQYTSKHYLGINDRLRVRVNSTFTGNVTAFIQAEALT